MSSNLENVKANFYHLAVWRSNTSVTMTKPTEYLFNGQVDDIKSLAYFAVSSTSKADSGSNNSLAIDGLVQMGGSVQ